MYDNDTRKRLENITGGIIIEGENDTCTAARNFLCSRFSTSTKVKQNFDFQSKIKKEQSELLKIYITDNNLWLTDYPKQDFYLAEGGEAKVYFDESSNHVIKINDGVYYATWLDFLNSILIHNLLFKATAYKLYGFLLADERLFAVLKQPFIIADDKADLNAVKKLLEFNGFRNTARNDYYNKELGLILEDIHDENVLVNSSTFFFIDTAFYIDIH